MNVELLQLRLYRMNMCFEADIWTAAWGGSDCSDRVDMKQYSSSAAQQHVVLTLAFKRIHGISSFSRFSNFSFSGLHLSRAAIDIQLPMYLVFNRPFPPVGTSP